MADHNRMNSGNVDDANAANGGEAMKAIMEVFLSSAFGTPEEKDNALSRAYATVAKITKDKALAISKCQCKPCQCAAAMEVTTAAAAAVCSQYLRGDSEVLRKWLETAESFLEANGG